MKEQLWEDLKTGYKDYEKGTNNKDPSKDLLYLMAYELGFTMASEDVPLEEELKEELVEHIRNQI